jgi:hypothetical protein
MRATYTSHLILHDLITLIIFDEAPHYTNFCNTRLTLLFIFYISLVSDALSSKGWTNRLPVGTPRRSGKII